MHEDDRPATLPLVRMLLRDQMPDIADLPLGPVASMGTDNVMFRLGDDLVLRFPRTPDAARQTGKEVRWLRHLAPHLTLPVPDPLRVGRPGAGYPFDWSVLRWIEGEDATTAPVPDATALARDLAEFVLQLREAETGTALQAADRPVGRGGPLAERHGFVRGMIAAVTDEGDSAEWTAFWDWALSLPGWTGAPVWLHGDLHGANILIRDGRLSAVIDWGCLGLGDPAYDLTPAWTLFDDPARAVFRDLACPDDAAWARGMALAGSSAISAIPYYRHSNPGLLALYKTTLARVLAAWRDRG